jgi:hypothetical protein
MPSLSLVVCVNDQRDFLERLLKNSEGCFDDLVVVSDGPDASNMRSLVNAAGGRFFEQPLEYQQESHWPFAWKEAAHDWILRLDADEFPSDEMKQWLETFRKEREPSESISGYTCIWPLWNGHSATSHKWPGGRNFLFHRQRVRFFGLNEQVPIPDGRYEALDLVLHHQPSRKSYGLHNLLMRPQAYRWRTRLVQALLGKPTDLQCWRWDSESWPIYWEEIRQRPIQTFWKRLILGPLRTLRDQWKIEKRFYPLAALHGSIHHALVCLAYSKARRTQKTRMANPTPDRDA